MTDVLLRMLCGATFGLALVLLLRRPARRMFGAGAAFTLWLLPLVLALAPLLPEQVAPRVRCSGSCCTTCTCYEVCGACRKRGRECWPKLRRISIHVACACTTPA